MKNYYNILEVNENATPDEIRKSYRSLALKYHPIDSSECKADYRGSIVNLKPATSYDIVLTLEGLTCEQNVGE